MITADLAAGIAQVMASPRVAAEFGTPTAAKRGRDPRWPYVPVVAHPATDTTPREWSEQIKGLAYATRDEAVAAAAARIQALHTNLETRLALPTHRALREFYGLPREV